MSGELAVQFVLSQNVFPTVPDLRQQSPRTVKDITDWYMTAASHEVINLDLVFGRNHFVQKQHIIQIVVSPEEEAQA